MYQRDVENKDTGFQTLEQNCFALRIGKKITHDVVMYILGLHIQSS